MGPCAPESKRAAEGGVPGPEEGCLPLPRPHPQPTFLAKAVRLEGGPSPLLKFPVFQMITCDFSAGLLSNLLPLWFWDYSSRLYKGKRRHLKCHSAAVANEQHCHFVEVPSSCVQQKVESKQPVLLTSAHYFLPLWRISLSSMNQ